LPHGKNVYKQIRRKIGEEVLIQGFVEAIRNQGKIKFLVIRDVTGIVQAVVLKDSPASTRIDALTLESVVSITGLVKEEAQAPKGFEIKVADLEVLSKSAPELAIPVIYEKSGGEVDISKRLNYRWLDLRRPEKQEIFTVWTLMEKGFRDYFLV